MKVTDEMRAGYKNRDRRLDYSDAPEMPPEFWENAVIGKFYKPVKTAVSLRIDADVLAWLKSKGDGHITRANEILRAAMVADFKKARK